MDNAGGILKLWWVDSQYYNGLVESDTGGLPRLDLDYCAINEISFTDDGGSLSVTDSEDDNGTSFSSNIVLRIPKVSESNISAIATVKDALKSRRVLLIILDNNLQYLTLGGSGSYFNVTRLHEHGAVMADLNHTKLQISGDLDQGPAFIDPMLLIEGEPDYAYDLSDIAGLEPGSESFTASFSVDENDAEFSIKMYRITSDSTSIEIGASATFGGVGYVAGTVVDAAMVLSESLLPLTFYKTEVWSA